MAAPLSEVLADSGIDHLAQASRWLAAHAGDRPVKRLPVFQEDMGDEDSQFSCCDEKGE
jgi:hypothetical protein